ncbi:DUF742 domain-containing protein [Streptomyces sp. NPDC058657]|uniref:DUF742 domain-containing protein n=1 Tax=unclassified Streptomyces TaxID=2593676 RepID=UPI00365E4369
MIEHQRAAEGSTQWYDAEAGPLVRPYARTGVREAGPGTASGAQPGASAPGDPAGASLPPASDAPPGTRLDLVAQISATAGAGEPDPALLSHVHHTLLGHCRAATQTLADLAAATGLPTGVVRELVDDLAGAGLVTWPGPVRPTQLPAELPLQEVIDGLRAL